MTARYYTYSWFFTNTIFTIYFSYGKLWLLCRNIFEFEEKYALAGIRRSVRRCWKKILPINPWCWMWKRKITRRNKKEILRFSGLSLNWFFRVNGRRSAKTFSEWIISPVLDATFRKSRYKKIWCYRSPSFISSSRNKRRKTPLSRKSKKISLTKREYLYDQLESPRTRKIPKKPQMRWWFWYQDRRILSILPWI